MSSILIIQHDEADPPATIGDALDEAGCAYTLVDAGRGEEVPTTVSPYVGVISMGGEMHVHQEDAFPFLSVERELLQECLATGIAVLGICLGAQLLAQTAGGRVYYRSYPEIGWVEVQTVTHDPLLIGVGSPFTCLQWHDYSFTLPPGAVRIAARDDGEQVFRVGARAWGLQFHPEVDADLAERWLVADAPRLEASRPGWVDEIRAATQVHMPRYPAFCRLLVRNFLSAAGLLPGEGAGAASA